MIRYTTSLLGVAGLFVGLGAFAILPSELEYAEMSFRDGVFDHAHTQMTTVARAAPDHAEAQFRLAQVQVHQGEVDAAMSTLEALIASGATDPLVVVTLAELKRSMGLMDAYMDLLLPLPITHLTTDQRNDLAGWLRYEGRHGDETAFLTRLEAAGVSAPAERHRLAHLLVADTQYEQAIERFAALDDADLLAGEPAMLTFLALLLRSGRLDDANVRAERWLSDASGTSLSWNVKRVFEARGAALTNYDVPTMDAGN